MQRSTGRPAPAKTGLVPVGHCLVNASVPLLNGGEHVLVPVYTPVMNEAVTLFDEPVMVIVQLGNTETPPGGTAIVNARVVPDSVPEKLPLKTTVPSVVDAVMVPDTAAPACVNRHVIRPGPDESDALPE